MLSSTSCYKNEPNNPGPGVSDKQTSVDLKKQTEHLSLRERILSPAHVENEKSFLFGIIHRHPAETLKPLLEGISSVGERHFKIAIAHYAPESILISIINLIREPSENMLITAIANQVSPQVISKLLKRVPLTRETLRAAIVHNLPENDLKYILTSVQPTPTDYLIARVHGAPLSALHTLIQSTDILIRAISQEESEEFLVGLTQAAKDLLPIEVLIVALELSKTKPILISILEKTIITTEVFLLALIHKIPEELQFGIIDALEIDAAVLSLAKTYEASEQIIKYISENINCSSEKNK